MSKYKNHKAEYKGMKFDSKKELARFKELEKLQEQGIISGLERQKEYLLIPKQQLKTPRINENGRASYCEKAVKYVADFVYTDSQGNTVVEDSKGLPTPEYS